MKIYAVNYYNGESCEHSVTYNEKYFLNKENAESYSVFKQIGVNMYEYASCLLYGEYHSTLFKVNEMNRIELIDYHTFLGLWDLENEFIHEEARRARLYDPKQLYDYLNKSNEDSDICRFGYSVIEIEVV